MRVDLVYLYLFLVSIGPVFLYSSMYACMTKTNGIVSLHVIEVLIAILTIFSFCVLKLLISMSYCMIVSMASSSRAPKHVWTKEEEATLVECMLELVSASGWKLDNDTFRPRYLTQLLRMMAAKLVGCNVHATTAINYCRKTLKPSYQTIAKIGGSSCSGFGWNVNA